MGFEKKNISDFSCAIDFLLTKFPTCAEPMLVIIFTLITYNTFNMRILLEILILYYLCSHSSIGTTVTIYASEKSQMIPIP